MHETGTFGCPFCFWVSEIFTPIPADISKPLISLSNCFWHEICFPVPNNNILEEPTVTRFRASLAAVLLASASLSAQAELLSGPVLDAHNTGWPNTGLQITALKDTTLNSFVFQNYGANDIIELIGSDGFVQNLFVFNGSGSETSSTITVNWDLAANTTYELISTDPNNSKWASAAPMQDDDLRVDGGFQLGAGVYPSLWFHFNDLDTGSAAGNIPEPGSLFLLGLGVAGLAAVRRRRAAR